MLTINKAIGEPSVCIIFVPSPNKQYATSVSCLSTLLKKYHITIFIITKPKKNSNAANGSVIDTQKEYTETAEFIQKDMEL